MQSSCRNCGHSICCGTYCRRTGAECRVKATGVCKHWISETEDAPGVVKVARFAGEARV